ncbi:unc-89, partial [Symbiodinium microadriaticum]
RDEGQQLRRSSSAPGGSLPAMDLDAMTQEAVALFQAGDAQAALDLAVAFANDAEQLLGRAMVSVDRDAILATSRRTHPVHVNALATVAALAEQMGCSKEAQDLLEEAEALHEEHEMEQEYFELEAEMESGTSSEPEKPVRAPSPALSTHTGSRASGDIPQGHSDTEDEEAEAESIRRLTWEVKEFLKDGQPDLAAQLLAEAEAELVAGSGRSEGAGEQGKAAMKGLTRAALHTLWAAVLEEVGEKDKAAALYDEALLCLKEEAALISSESEEEEEDEAETPSLPSELRREPLLPLPVPTRERSSDSEKEDAKDKATIKTEDPRSPPSRERSDSRPSSLRERTAEEPPAAKVSLLPTPPLQQAPSEEARPERKAAASAPKPIPKAGVVNPLPPVIPRQVATPPSKPPAKPVEAPTEISEKSSEVAAVVEALAKAPEAEAKDPPSEAPAKSCTKGAEPDSRQPSAQSSRTTTPKAAAKRRPAPLAPKAPAKSAPNAVRVGGGFKVLAPNPPKAPTPPKAGRRPKAKAKTKAASSIAEEATVVEQDGPVEMVQELEQSAPPPQEELSHEQLKQRACQAMVTADHFLGLCRFERAADLLENQLEAISDESCPLCNSDLHVELLTKYGGILWWDGDGEGAIDAYTAADEVLAERMQAEKDLQLMRRRAQIWGLMAQVYRHAGRLGAAERRLAAATATLELMLSMPECASSAGSSDKPSFAASVQDLLRDTRAALGQVCVQKKDYDRAQELYLLAFSPEPRSGWHGVGLLTGELRTNIAHFARDALWLHRLFQGREPLESLSGGRTVEQVLTKHAATECIENDRCVKTGRQVIFSMEQFLEEVAFQDSILPKPPVFHAGHPGICIIKIYAHISAAQGSRHLQQHLKVAKKHRIPDEPCRELHEMVDGPIPQLPSEKFEVSADLTPDLLRGVPFHSCLSGTGGHWCHPDSSWRPKTSRQKVEQYDVFFSHDWQTGRWSKHLSLLVAFNGVPAATASWAASFAMGLFSCLGILPQSLNVWMPVWGYMVSLAIFFFWQHVRRLFLGPTFAFIDSICIPQDDEVLKARCIQGLGTFLARSEQLVVLWSPQYFRRLWCCYELTFFLLKKGKGNMIRFVPVQIGRICVCLFIGVLLFQVTLYVILSREGDAIVVTGIMSAVLLLQAIVILPVLQYTMTAMLKDLSQLPRQVSEFRVQASECTCCAQQHRHPVTHAPIACDRELIYESLRNTFGPSGGKMEEEAALDAFNGYVSETLAGSLDLHFRHHSMILRYALVTCATACGPWVSLTMTTACGYSMSGEDLLRWIGLLIYVDAGLLCVMRIALLIGHFGAFRMETYPGPVIVLSQVAMLGFSSAATFLPWPVAWALSVNGYPWIWTSVLAAMLCISCCFLWPAFNAPFGTPVSQPDLPSTTYGRETGSSGDEDERSTFEI